MGDHKDPFLISKEFLIAHLLNKQIIQGGKKMRTKIGILMKVFLYGVIGSFLFSLIISEAKAEKIHLRLVSGSTGGTYYIIMAGMAKLIEKNSKNITCSVQAGTTATENFKLVGRKDADIGIGGTDSAYYGYRGTREFDKKYDKLRWLIKGYISLNHTIVLKDSPFKKIEDLRGKRIASYPGSTAEFQTPAILEAFNMAPGKDYVKMPLKIGEAVAALKDGNVDAIVQVGGVPMAAVTDVATTKGIRLLEIPEDKINIILNKYPWFVKGIIPAGSYPGVFKEIPTVGHDVIIFSHADLPSDAVYSVMSAVFDNIEELAQIHPLGATFKKETGFIGSEKIIPLHPGAEKYYKDKGVLK